MRLPLVSPDPAAQADVPCPRPAEKKQVPGVAVTSPDCIWQMSVDLDGDRRPDRLVGWRKGEQRGLVAYLADGSVHPLSNEKSTSAGATQGWTLAGAAGDTGPVYPLAVWQLGSEGRHFVVVTDTPGAHGWGGVLVGLDAAGALALVKDTDGVVFDVAFAADLGCVAQGNDRLLTWGVSQSGPAAGEVPGYAVRYYRVDPQLRATLVGHRGAYGGHAAASLRVTDCPPSPRLAPVLAPLASSDRQAVLQLLTGVSKRDHDAVAALVDPTLAQPDLGGEWEYDVETYLTTTTGGVRAWLGYPIDSCHDSDGVHDCLVIGQTGYPLDVQVAQIAKSAWVVVGVKAG